MDVDPLEAADSGDNGHSRLNSRVAITVALLATFMGICKVKDDNIVQAMQQAQADKIDHWAFYQARNIRQDVAQSEVVTLTIQRRTAAAADRAAVDSGIARFQALVKDQAVKKDSLRVQAEQDQKTYDSLNYRDDQFDLVRRAARARDLAVGGDVADAKGVALLDRDDPHCVWRAHGSRGTAWAATASGLHRAAAVLAGQSRDGDTSQRRLRTRRDGDGRRIDGSASVSQDGWQ